MGGRRPETAPRLDRAIGNRCEGEIVTDGVPMLTDDYAPTDALLVAPWRRSTCGQTQPKKARAVSYHSAGTVLSSAVASSSETSTMLSP